MQLASIMDSMSKRLMSVLAEYSGGSPEIVIVNLQVLQYL